MSQFPTTEWTAVLAAGSTSSAVATPALERLCRTYWFPLYAYTRQRGYGPHEAEDLTQSFFTQILQNDFFKRVGQGQGRFRSFLLASMNYFLLNEWDKFQTQKRGGGKQICSWDEINAEEKYHLYPVNNLTPEQLFERQWAYTLIEEVMKRLKAEQSSTGKSAQFSKYQAYLTLEPPTGFHAAVALEFGISEGASKTALHRLRRQFGELLRRQIAFTVSSPDQVEDEIRYLIDLITG